MVALIAMVAAAELLLGETTVGADSRDAAARRHVMPRLRR
jgi:hypothetical protein